MHSRVHPPSSWLLLGPVALGALLLGSVVSGEFLAFLMTNGGGGLGQRQGVHRDLTPRREKRTRPAHAAGVMGDTVGDPFEGTVGPPIDSLIKVLIPVSIVLVSAVVVFALFV